MIEYFEHEGVPFIAMEYLERGSLRPLVGQLTLAQVAGVLDSVLGGLAEAAAQGIVHRDLKPENVLVTADGHAKVADFGIAKAIGQVCMTDFRTATGQIVGTPAYMAPEQISGGEITPQVDLYATGLIAYELLAGRHPFHGTDAPMALLMRHVNDDPPPLASVRPDLPPGVVAWVHAMLAKDPAARPAGAAHAWDRLEGVVSDALGPRWRRAALLTESAAEPPAEAEPAPPSERSGIFSVVLPPVPVPGQTSSASAVPEPAHPRQPEPVHSALVQPEPVHSAPVQLEPVHSEPVLPTPLHSEPALPTPVHSEPVHPAPVHSAPMESHRAPAFPVAPQPPDSAPDRPAPLVGGRRPRARTLLLALAGALLVAVATIMYSTAPGEEPRAAPRPAGPSLDERVRKAVAPALADNARLSSKLSSLVPGADPGAARDRASAAIPTTNVARTALSELRATSAGERLLRARAQRALSAQSDYLEIVVVALALQTDDGQLERLGPVSARLVSRLGRIETAVPRASETVGGARRLKAWATAELAAQVPPAAHPAAPAAPAQPLEPSVPGPTTPAPAPTATATAEPTPDPTATPTPSVDDRRERQRPIRRRARLRRHLEALVVPVPAE